MNRNLNNVELRRLTSAPELRIEREERADGGDARYISGYAVVFEQYSRPFWDEWVELIERGAFDETDMSDVVMVVDHSRDVRDVLARSKNGVGSLEITVDDVGVKFRFPVPDTAVGRDLLTLVERGDISECSFAFWVGADMWEYDKIIEGKKMDVRRIVRVARLADLSIVVTGQYPQPACEIDERAVVAELRASARAQAKPLRAMSLSTAKAICEL